MSFDGLARHYRWLELVLAGGVLQRCRTAFLDRTRRAESVLLLGEGNGRFLCPFLQANPAARVVCVEQSAQMIREARRALLRSGIHPERVAFVHQDVLHWEPPAQEFDLIVTHFFLDCFTREQLRFLVPRIAGAGRSGCIWLWADFQLPPAGFLRLRARVAHKLMYAFFRVATNLPARRLTPPAPFLAEAGFERAAGITAQFGLIRSDCWLRRNSAPRGVRRGRPSVPKGRARLI